MSQTKLDEGFPASKLHLYGHVIKARKNRKRHRGGLTEVVKRDFICN